MGYRGTKFGLVLMAIVLLANSFQFGTAQTDKVAAGMVTADPMAALGGFNHQPVASKLLAAKISGVRAKVSGVREHLDVNYGDDMMTMMDMSML
ncbi:hypothetical protein KSW81_007216 [Nannochloris sp. 'desiccata']|nr:hypothetical protein KSW81_007216 [Chlorella desiccata (nom. nud.)]